MAYTPHVLCTFGGTLNEIAAQDEIWQCGVRLAVLPDFDEEAYVGEIADNLAAWFSAATSFHHTATRLTFIKAAKIEADGNYPSDTYAPAHAVYETPVPGGSNVGAMPAFCSIAYSWKTVEHRRGPASNGRIYPPNFAMPCVAGSSSIQLVDAQVLVGAAQQLLAVLQNATGDQNTSPSIYSKVNGAAGTITSVKIGTIYDTQTRRKRKWPEAYAAGTYPA